jgi:glycosyltransferase involved in cell wall biosynthesis
MRILLVSHYFPPQNVSGALRPYSWAKYWSRSGHKVTVLTSKKTSLDGALNFVDPRAANNTFKTYEVEYWPFRAASAGSPRLVQTAPFQGSHNAKQIKNIIRRLRRYLGDLADLNYPWIVKAIRLGRNLHQREAFDIIVSTYTPAASHIIGSHLKRTLGIPWVADFRDLWTANHLAQSVWPFRTLNRWLEKTTVTHADLIITISEPFQRKMQATYKAPCVTVENGFDPEEIEDLAKESLYPDDGKLRFIYTGMLYPGKRDPAPLFAAVRRLIQTGKLAPTNLEFLFYGSNLRGLQELAQQYGLQDIVKTPGHVDRATVLRAQRDADGLIFLEWDDPSAEGVLTGKIFEYMKAGTPVLGIGLSRASSSGKLLEEAGIGYALAKDVDNIAAFLINNYLRQSAPVVRPNQHLINSFSRSIQAQKVLAQMETIVAR